MLRNGSDPEQRAIAAAIINYAPDKKAVLDDLQYAMQDPDEAVRANAMRAVNAIAVLAAKRPDLGLRIPSTWFVEMLNSIALSDRTRAAAALVNLTDKDAKATLEQIRARALPSVVEMARWRTLRFALPAYILIGRMAGMTEPQIEESWTKGETGSGYTEGCGRKSKVKSQKSKVTAGRGWQCCRTAIRVSGGRGGRLQNGRPRHSSLLTFDF